MSIKSTSDISRNQAIERIRFIYALAVDRNYRAIAAFSFEPNYRVSDFVETIDEIVDIDNLDSFTNKMLEGIVDTPFFRKSMFDNYIVID